MSQSTGSRPNLSADQIEQLLSDLLVAYTEENGEGQLARGAVPAAAKKYNVTRSTVYRIWKRAQKNRAEFGAFRAKPQKKGNSGRKLKYDREALQEEVDALPSDKRGAVRPLASALGLPSSTVHHMIQKGDIQLR
jgi:DNA invertase Pin-like site-specific DNA recombinase